MKEKRGRGGISTLKKSVWGCRRKTGVSLRRVEVLKGDRGHGPSRGGGVGKEWEGGGTLMKVICGCGEVRVLGFTCVLPKTI